MKSTMTLFLALVSTSVWASNITCNVNSEVDGISQPSYKMVLPLDTDSVDCEKSTDYTIPGTQVRVLVYGHGNCNPNPGMCPDVGPSINGIESMNYATDDYSKTFGTCTKAKDEMFFQTILQRHPKVNVVVGCLLNPYGGSTILPREFDRELVRSLSEAFDISSRLLEAT